MEETMTDHPNKATYGVLNYDILEISCETCGNWVELSGGDPRCRAENYDFRFNDNAPIPSFTCCVCNSQARESYYKVRDITAEIRAAIEEPIV